MSILRPFLILFVLISASFGQVASLRGVDLTDMDRSVDACKDFYEYANGTWRKQNPIPASMPRWSRRWEAGEKAKDRLREILEDVSSKGPYKAGTVDQIVSDFYLSCKDQTIVDKNGMEPVKARLAAVDAI